MRSQHHERGAAAVEFGLVLPLLMLVLMGILDWGYYFFVSQIVTNAAREGARAGSVEVDDDARALNQAERAAEDYIGGVGLNPNQATIDTTISGGAVRVRINYPTGSLTGFTRLVLPSQVRSLSEMRRY